MAAISRHAPEWHALALCATPDHAEQRDLWFAARSDKAAIAEAKRICSQCPVLQRCGEYALFAREDRGIWGGMTEGERRRLHKRAYRRDGGGSGVHAFRSSKAA